MIVTDRTITVRKGVSSIDDPVIVYRGDYEVAIRFTIMNNKFKFMSGVNMIESEKASYGQLAILTPYGGNVFSDMVRCSDGAVTFVMTKELMDQIEEVGLYSFQIRLFDGNRESRISIPPVEFGIEIREPVASEDHDNEVNNAIVGYSIAKVVDGLNEDVGDTFDANGQYNKTDWETGDRISEGKLNKIEDAIDQINQNEKNDVADLKKAVKNNYNILNATKADDQDLTDIQTQVNNLVLGAVGDGNNAEVVQARGSYSTLNERIDSLTNAKGIKNESITQDKMSVPYAYGKMGQNLFDPDTVTPDCYPRYGDGGLGISTSHCASGFIQVTPGLPYVVSNGNEQIALYDSNKKYVTGYMHSSELSIIPDNAYYLRITVSKSYLDKAMVIQGEKTIPYEPYYITLDVDKIIEPIPAKSLDESIIKGQQSYNLFNKKSATVNMYVNYLHGRLSSADGFIASDYIAVEPNEYYMIVGTSEQCAFYDEFKNFVSGYDFATKLYNTPIPSNVHYMRITCKTRELDGVLVHKGNDYMEYEKNGYLITQDVLSQSLTNEINPLNLEPSHNLFNSNTVEKGKYISYTNGSTGINNNGYNASDYISIEPNEYYTIKGANGQMALYDYGKMFIKGYLYASELNGERTPSNARYMRITSRDSELNSTQVYKGTEYREYEKYGYIVPEEKISAQFINKLTFNNTVKITVGVNKQFDNLRTALESITDASENKQYEVYIDEGEYDILSYYTLDEYTDSSFIGLQKPHHVSLIGVGDKHKVILKGFIPVDSDAATINRVSTLVTKGTGRLENLTITAENLRYAVHDDYRDGGTELKRVVKDCIFIKKGIGYQQAYGSGVYAGHKHYFENCEFYTNKAYAYSAHNNKNFSMPASIKLVGCKIMGEESPGGFRFGSMGSGQKDEIIIIGCETNGRLYVMEEQNNGVGIDFIIKGYANDVFDVEVQGTTSKTITNTNGFIKTVK